MTGPKVSQLPFDLFSPSFPKRDRDGERALCARSLSWWSLESSILTRYGTLDLIYTTYPGPLWVFFSPAPYTWPYSESLPICLLNVLQGEGRLCYGGWSSLVSQTPVKEVVLHLPRGHLRHISYIIGHTDLHQEQRDGRKPRTGSVLSDSMRLKLKEALFFFLNKITASANSNLQNIVNKVTKAKPS